MTTPAGFQDATRSSYLASPRVMPHVRGRSASLWRTLQTGLAVNGRPHYLLTISCRKSFVRLFHNPNTLSNVMRGGDKKHD